MKYSLIDLHCDTGSVALDKNEGFYKNSLQIDLEKMKDYNYTQFFAAFIAPEYKETAMARAMEIIKKTKSEILKSSGRMALCKNYKDYCQNEGKIRAFLSLEGGEPIGSEEALLRLYDEGVRLVALSWNYKNQICAGVLEEDETLGVTEFGKEIIALMNKLGIIIDVSHLNDKSFWDVLELSKKPVIASHSNSRTICPNKRNLTDEQFLAIKRSGGIVGINFYPYFLTEEKNASVEDIIRHIEHFLALGGEDFLGIGADFDGVSCLPRNICGAEDVSKLFDEMLKYGYKEEIIKKISCTNMERFLKENL